MDKETILKVTDYFIGTIDKTRRIPTVYEEVVDEKKDK